MTLVGELDVFEIVALALAEREKPVAEGARLRNRAPRVVHPMDHEELRGKPVGELDGTSVAPEVAVLLGIAHLLAQEVPEVLLALVPHLVEIADPHPGDRGAPEIRLLGGRDERHEAAVASTEDHEALGVDVRQGRDVLRRGGHILEVRPTPVLERRIAEVDPVPG